MMSSTLRTSVAVAAIAAMIAVATPAAVAQCCGEPQPTVAYSPVLTPAPAPVVYQNYDPWFPGKYLGRVVTWPFRAVGRAITTPIARPPAYAAPVPTYQTAAYQPTYSPTYSASYAPTSYTVGYAPSTYNVSYAPSVQTVARPVTLTSMDSCGCGPVCCGSCGTDSCCGGGVTTAGYETSSSGCSSCASQPVQSSYYDDRTVAPPQEPTPALDPNANVPQQRVNRPISPEVEGEESLLKDSTEEADGSTSYWNAPQLFDARDRSAQMPSRQPSVRMWNAVYHQPTSRPAPQATDRTAYRTTTASMPAPKPAPQNGARGWRAVD